MCWYCLIDTHVLYVQFGTKMGELVSEKTSDALNEKEVISNFIKLLLMDENNSERKEFEEKEKESEYSSFVSIYYNKMKKIVISCLNKRLPVPTELMSIIHSLEDQFIVTHSIPSIARINMRISLSLSLYIN